MKRLNHRQRILRRSAVVALVCILMINQAEAQMPTSTWVNYIRKLMDSASSDQHISLSYLSNGNYDKHIFCTPRTKYQFVATNVGDSLFQQIALHQPDLFTFLNQNRKYLLAAEHAMLVIIRQQNIESDNAIRTKVEFGMGIKIDGFHFNHFYWPQAEALALEKSEKVRKGYEVLNYVRLVLEKSLAQSTTAE